MKRHSLGDNEMTRDEVAEIVHGMPQGMDADDYLVELVNRALRKRQWDFVARGRMFSTSSRGSGSASPSRKEINECWASGYVVTMVEQKRCKEKNA
jgi:hypothetical protein